MQSRRKGRSEGVGAGEGKHGRRKTRRKIIAGRESGAECREEWRAARVGKNGPP